MKLTIEEKKIQKNFEPGYLTRDGFLGKDTRHVHDIIEADKRNLSEIGIGQNQIADRLQYFMDAGKAGLESGIVLGDYKVHVRWERGRIVCPFEHPGVYPLIIVKLENHRSRKTLIFTHLSVHLIRQHGFFGGKDSVYRIDPMEAAELLGLTKEGVS